MSAFPVCELYQICVVDRFPARCPFRTVDPLTTVTEILDGAWQKLSQRPASDPSAHDDFQRAAICEECVNRLSRDRIVKQLRQRFEFDRVSIGQPPQPTPPSSSISSERTWRRRR